MEMISEDKLRNIAGKRELNLIYVEKDYFLTLLMWTLREVKGIHLKGGTALNKLFLDHSRLSEDLDFAADRPLAEIKTGIEEAIEASKLFTKLEKDNETAGFVRYRAYYRSYFERNSCIMIDVNKKASILLGAEMRRVPNFYGLEFSVSCLKLKEILAEKIRALMTRNQPRDYFDAYLILKDHEPRIDMLLVRKKVEEAGERFDKERIFRNARKVYSRWEADLFPLTNKKLGFLECMRMLKKKA